MADPTAVLSAVDISVQRIAQDTQKTQAEELLAPLAKQPARSDAASFSPEALAMLANQTGSTGTSFTA